MAQEEQGPVIRLAAGLEALQRIYDDRIRELESELALIVEAY